MLRAELRHPVGAPENPLSDAAVVAKFRDNAELALPAGRVRELEAAVLALERQTDLAALTGPLAAARAALGSAVELASAFNISVTGRARFCTRREASPPQATQSCG